MFCNSQSMLMGSCLHRSWTVGDSCAFIPALDTEVTIKTRKLRGMMSELPGGAQLLPWALQECRVHTTPHLATPTSCLSQSLPLCVLSLVSEESPQTNSGLCFFLSHLLLPVNLDFSDERKQRFS